MKRYEYEEWDLKDPYIIGFDFDERIYIDLSGNLITGILEGFYAYADTDGTKDEKNCQYVENGKRVIVGD